MCGTCHDSLDENFPAARGRRECSDCHTGHPLPEVEDDPDDGLAIALTYREIGPSAGDLGPGRALLAAALAEAGCAVTSGTGEFCLAVAVTWQEGEARGLYRKSGAPVLHVGTAEVTLSLPGGAIVLSDHIPRETGLGRTPGEAHISLIRPLMRTIGARVRAVLAGEDVPPLAARSR